MSHNFAGVAHAYWHTTVSLSATPASHGLPRIAMGCRCGPVGHRGALGCPSACVAQLCPWHCTLHSPQTSKGSITEDEAQKLGANMGVELYSQEKYWAEAEEIFAKYQTNPKGAAGKKAMPHLAALVRGRTHAAVSIIEKNGAPATLMKFAVDHKIHWLELDPITLLVLMLSLGSYGLGSSWIAVCHAIACLGAGWGSTQACHRQHWGSKPCPCLAP